MGDIVKDWTKIIKKKESNTGIKPDKNFKQHFVKPCKMIACVGSTGSGKSNSLLEFLHRKNNAFHEIILFTGSTSDEDLYNLLNDAMDGEINMIEDIDELPDLTDYNDCDKGVEKLIIFDDIINLKKKELEKIKKWFNSARKYGFTCLCMAQNWTDLPTQIRRNCHYIWLFKLKDQNQVCQILKTSNQDNLNLEVLKDMYKVATRDIGQFLNIDMTENDPRNKYRKNFIEFLF